MNLNEIKKRLEEIEARVEKASPGPWAAKGSTIYPKHDSPQYITCGHWDDVYNDETLANMEFIAHSRDDVPWLCQVVRNLLDRLHRLEAAVEAAEKRLKEGENV